MIVLADQSESVRAAPDPDPAAGRRLVVRLRELADELRDLGVTSLHAYGSRIAGTPGPASDLDVFVDHAAGRKFSLFDLVGAKARIEQHVGLDVDITTRDGLNPLLRDGILGSAVRVF